MQITRLIATTLAGLASSALLAQGALAGGEPKNEWPFTRHVDSRSAQAATHQLQTEPAIQGEPKNEPPFTRPVVVAAATRSGFSWHDGAVGGLGGIGLAVAGAGSVLALRKSPRIA